jgi:hypothetical protein
VSSSFTINKSELFDEIMLIRNCFLYKDTQQKIKEMRSFEEIWLYVFKFNTIEIKLLNLKKIV